MIFSAAALSYCLALAAGAQVREPADTLTAGDGAGVLSDVSGPVGADSPPVHDPFSTTLGEASGGTMRSGPVSGMGSRSMKSGPVSDISRGALTAVRRSPITSGAVTHMSAGAVKHDIAKALGERISQPLHELAPLQRAMREKREQADQAAVSARIADDEGPPAGPSNGNDNDPAAEIRDPGSEDDRAFLDQSAARFPADED